MSGRWGKPFKDSRNWVPYNEELVARGEFLLELEWVKSWDKELEEMNQGKIGKPYGFPESLIKLQGLWHQWVDYRGVEGITRKLVEHGNLPKYNDFSTISRRVRKLDMFWNGLIIKIMRNDLWMQRINLRFFLSKIRKYRTINDNNCSRFHFRVFFKIV